MTMNDEQHINRLRRLRVLQALQSAHPNPMGELAILNAVQIDPELKPTIDRVRNSLHYLFEAEFIEIITVPDAVWMAGRITTIGMGFLAASEVATNADIYHPSEIPESISSARRGQVSSVTVLPTEVKAWLDQELVRRHFSDYVALSELLAEKGYTISKSSIHRYGQKFKEEQEKLKQSIEMAKAFAAVVGDDGAAMNQTLTALVQQEIMSVVREGKYDDDDIKLPALVRSVASLNRSDINTRKFQIEQAARKQALNDAANAVDKAAIQKGLTKDQAQFWRELVLGVK